jgi:hypothetical protein
MIAKTRSLSPARKLRSIPGLPHISLREMSHARPALHTVFSTIQLELLKPNKILAITVLEMLAVFTKQLTFRKKQFYNLLTITAPDTFL